MVHCIVLNGRMHYGTDITSVALWIAGDCLGGHASQDGAEDLPWTDGSMCLESEGGLSWFDGR